MAVASEYDLMLRPRVPGFEPLHFVWFVGAGLAQITKDALGDLLDLQLEQGWVALDPPPDQMEFTDPMTNPDQMVAFLNQFWILPPELMELYPVRKVRKLKPGEVN